MDQGPTPDAPSDPQAPIVFEMLGSDAPELALPDLPPPATPPDAAPPEPVLLFRPPEPSGVRVGARALVRVGAQALVASGSALTRGVGERAGRLRGLEPPTLSVPALGGSVLLWVVAAVLAGVWAVVGAFFWLPVLVGGVARFSVFHLQAMLVGGGLTEAAWRLRQAVSFYRRGFSAILDAVGGPETAVGDGGNVAFPPPFSVDWFDRRMLARACGALAVWYPALLLVGVVDWTPLHAWEWMSASPWQDLSAGLGERIVTGFTEVAHAAARLTAEGR